jgi:hypothetical protein
METESDRNVIDDSDIRGLLGAKQRFENALRKRKASVLGSRNVKAAIPGNQQLTNNYTTEYASSSFEKGKESLMEGFLKFFGEPIMPYTMDGYQNYPRETYTLPEAYRGQSSYMAKIIFHKITETDLWLLRVLAKIRLHNATDTIVLDEFRFDTHTLTRVPYESVGKMVTSRYSQKKMKMIRFGIGTELEMGFFLTDRGQWMWRQNVEQIKQAIILTLILDVIVECMKASSKADGIKERYDLKYDVREFKALLQQECDRWALIQKAPKNPLQVLAGRAKEIYKQRGVRDVSSLAFIIPSKVDAYCSQRPERTDYEITGIPSKNLPPETIGSIPGVGSIYTFEPIILNEGLAPVDPMRQNVSIGEFYHIPSNPTTLTDPSFKSRDSIINIHESQKDDWKALPPSVVIDYALLFDNRGALTRIGNTFFNTNERKNLWDFYKADDKEYDSSFCKDALTTIYSDSKKSGLLVQWMEDNKLPIDNIVNNVVARERKEPIPELQNEQPIWSGTMIEQALKQILPVHYKKYFQFAVLNNIPTLLGCLLLRPHMTFRAASVVAALTDNTMSTFVGNPDFAIGDDVKRKIHTGSFTMNTKVFTHEENHLIRFPNVFIDDVIRGWDCEFFKAEDENDYKSGTLSKDIFAVALSPNESANFSCVRLDLTGRFDSDLVQEKNTTPHHYRMANAYANFWGWKSTAARSVRNKFDNSVRAQKHNTICFQGTQLNWNSVGEGQGSFNQLVNGQGHMRDCTYPGCGAVIRGTHHTVFTPPDQSQYKTYIPFPSIGRTSTVPMSAAAI